MSSEEKIQPEEFDRELEKLMTGSGDGKETKKKKGKGKKILIGIVLLAVGGAAVMKFSGSGKPKIPVVMTMNPMRQDVQNCLSVSGPISGTDSVDVVSNIHAEVLEIPVKEGERVEKGQVLAVLDDTDIKKEVDIAKNDYDLAVSTCSERDREARNGYAKAVQDFQTAQANYDRIKILYDGGNVPLVDLETAQNTLNDARRQMDAYTVRNGTAVADDSYRLQIEKERFNYEKAQENLEDTQIKSPIAGTVVRVNTKVGRFADKMEDERPLFVIENLDVLEMEIEVSEYSIGKVSVGQEATISADILDGETVRGEVVSISPTGEEKSGGSSERVIPTTIRILDQDTRLIAGITAKAEIVLEESEQALAVPASALIEQEGNIYVQAVSEGMIHWIPVTTGVESDLMTEINAAEGEALDESTQIIAAPNLMYTEGMEVTGMMQ